jgi:hypothetical protein
LKNSKKEKSKLRRKRKTCLLLLSKSQWLHILKALPQTRERLTNRPVKKAKKAKKA